MTMIAWVGGKDASTGERIICDSESGKRHNEMPGEYGFRAKGYKVATYDDGLINIFSYSDDAGWKATQEEIAAINKRISNPYRQIISLEYRAFSDTSASTIWDYEGSHNEDED